MKRVTLLYLRREGDVLLAMKKRGFGKGKWNGVGGKADPGESITAAAIRECQEEIGVTPRQLRRAGVLVFRMSHDPAFYHRAYIFTAAAWQGTPRETAEMRPQWFPAARLPYDTMWPDDRLWLPLVLAGRPFRGTITLGPDDQTLHADITETP